MTHDPVLSIENLRVWYGTARGSVRAADGVSLDVRAGETLGLVGESGCGKSTLGRGILGLLPEGAAAQGEVRFKGRNLVGLPQKRLRGMRGPDIGLIFQEPMTRLNPLLRIEDHFRETLRAHEPGLDDDQMRRRSLEALAGMGIPPTRFRHYPHEFSGGMRQRIMIALALVLRPALVIADEPTTALDVIVEAQVLAILADLKPFWAGVRAMEAGSRAVTVAFHEPIDPELVPAGGVEVACHLYDDGALDAAGRARAAAEEPRPARP